MRHSFTLLALSLLSFSVSGQSNFVKIGNFWQSPEFNQEFVLDQNIKRIAVTAYSGTEPVPAKQLTSTAYAYNRKGWLVSQVETEKQDTSRVFQYGYSRSGLLKWKLTLDKIWNKQYRMGYRFNQSRKLFQIKSYEVLNNEGVMLLDTRQYIYNADSLVIAIRYLQNNQVLRTQHYAYDELGRVIKEVFEDAAGKVKREISYSYDQMDQLTEVVTREGATTAYRYAYGPNGRPTEVQWWEGEVKKGVVSYTYDEAGYISQMTRVFTDPLQPMEASLASLRVFEYEHHPKETKESPGTELASQ